jgi:chromosome segregation ATPase
MLQVQEEEWRVQEVRLKEQLKELRTKLKEQAVDYQIQLAAREEAWQEERQALIQSADQHVAAPTAGEHVQRELQSADSKCQTTDHYVPTSEANETEKAQLLVINAELKENCRIKDVELAKIQARYEELDSKFQETEARAQQMKEECLQSELQYQTQCEGLQARCCELQTNYADLEARWQDLTDRECKLKVENEVLFNDCQNCKARLEESESKLQELERECAQWGEKLKVAYENRDREVGLKEAEKAELTRQLEEVGKRLERYEKEAAATAGGHKVAAAAAASESGSGINVAELVAENKGLKVRYR